MKLLNWLEQGWQWFRGHMACGGKRPGEMRYAGSDRDFPDSQLTLPGMALQREWTYGKLR